MRREYVFAFEGQGSVFPDVMKEEYFGVPKFRELFDEISELMKEDIKDICWGRRKYKLKTNPYKVSLKKEERNSIFITFSRFMGEYLTPKDIGNVLCYFLGRIKEYITFDEIVVVDSLGVISSIKSKLGDIKVVSEKWFPREKFIEILSSSKLLASFVPYAFTSLYAMFLKNLLLEYFVVTVLVKGGIIITLKKDFLSFLV